MYSEQCSLEGNTPEETNTNFENFAKQSALQLLGAHELGVIHADVKPENMYPVFC